MKTENDEATSLCSMDSVCIYETKFMENKDTFSEAEIKQNVPTVKSVFISELGRGVERQTEVLLLMQEKTLCQFFG